MSLLHWYTLMLMCMMLPGFASAQTYKFYFNSKVMDDKENIIFENKSDSITVSITPDKISLYSSLWGNFTMSRNVELKERDIKESKVFSCFDTKSNVAGQMNGFAYIRKATVMSPNMFMVYMPARPYVLTNGIFEVKSEAGETIPLFWCTIDDDPIIKLMKWLTQTARPTSSPSSSSVSSSATTKLNGYMYSWNDYYGKANEKQNGAFSFRTDPSSHYIEVMFGNHVTNLSPAAYKKVRWSTRRGAIKVSLRGGVKINSDDEIITWEQNGTSSDPDYRKVVTFIWTPTTHQLQCLYTVRRHFNGRTINDYYYFRTTSSDVYSSIKARLMHELPHCGTRIE